MLPGVAKYFLLKRPGFEFIRNTFFYTMFVRRSIITRKGNRKATFLMIITTILLKSHIENYTYNNHIHFNTIVEIRNDKEYIRAINNDSEKEDL
ncbi:hypothetical protein V1477_021193 [Vespula maculifrons]|uniref:Uncharacterized protein n=1 Tax=Vespula maculifrons TaxID=7453 RepID=A0ABD2AGI0_VESMC